MAMLADIGVYLFSTPSLLAIRYSCEKKMKGKISHLLVGSWQPLGPLLKVKLLVGPTCKIPRSTQRRRLGNKAIT